MIKIKMVKWVDFKKIVLLVQNEMSTCHGFGDIEIADGGRILDNVECDVFDQNHIFARIIENVDLHEYIEWFIDDSDTLKMWRDFMDELANTAMFNGFNGNVSRHDYNVIQSICDDIESYLTDMGGM